MMCELTSILVMAKRIRYPSVLVVATFAFLLLLQLDSTAADLETSCAVNVDVLRRDKISGQCAELTFSDGKTVMGGEARPDAASFELARLFKAEPKPNSIISSTSEAISEFGSGATGAPLGHVASAHDTSFSVER